MFYTAKEASFFNLIMTWSCGRDSFSIRIVESITRDIYPFSNRHAKTDVQKGYRESQSLFLVGRNSAGRERDQAEESKPFPRVKFHKFMLPQPAPFILGRRRRRTH